MYIACKTGTDKLEVLLEGAYTCSPSLFKSSTSNPVERTSLQQDFYSDLEYECKSSYIYISSNNDDNPDSMV